jgi:hypothetical protein
MREEDEKVILYAAMILRDVRRELDVHNRRREHTTGEGLLYDVDKALLNLEQLYDRERRTCKSH